MNEYNAGDLVEAVKGERVIRDRIHGGTVPLFIEAHYLGVPTLFGPSSIREYIANGFTLAVIEKAAPPLPTILGYYTDSNNGMWMFDNHGFKALHVDGFAGIFNRDYVRHLAPFTRLEPVPTTTARIALSLENNGQTIAADNVRNWYGE